MDNTTLSAEVERVRIHKLWQEKLDADPWNGWRALLNGWKVENTAVPVSDGEPFTGYYRTKRSKEDKTFAPVAYWKEDGKWICIVDGIQVSDTRAMQLWAFASRYPISHAWYKAVAEEGKPWPDADERVSRKALQVAHEKPEKDDARLAAENEIAFIEVDNERARVGGNNPPEETGLEAIKNKITNAKGGVADYKEIKDDEHLARALSLKNRLTELASEADKERKALKEPHWLKAKAVDDEWMPTVKDAEAAAKEVGTAMSAYETKKLELRRQAEAETERRRKAAEAIEAENLRKIREAEDEGKSPDDVELEQVPHVEETKPPEENATIRPGYGSAKKVKTEWYVKSITDIGALLTCDAMKTHPEMIALATQLAERAKNKANMTLPGVELAERAKV